MDFFKLIKDPSKTRENTGLAYKTIVKDLYDNNLRGSARARNVFFYEDEKAFSDYGHFIPGCFYIFFHESEALFTEDGRKEFHDVVPIFLSLSVGREESKPFVFGINFNILTRPVRAAILQEIYDMDRKFFDGIYADRMKGKHRFSQIVYRSFVQDGGMKFCNYICQKYGIKKSSIAFRKYYFENISKCRLIDYWQWEYLPFLEISKGVRGVALKELQKEAVNK